MSHSSSLLASHRAIDITGKMFGRLTVINLSPSRNDHKLAWNCECVCGSTVVISSRLLRDGRTRSCGCLQREESSKRMRKHALRKHYLYPTWSMMLDRCRNPRNKDFPRYGGRGISICARWLQGSDIMSGFECFLIDMGERPEGRTLDRRDNDGNYEPENCRWATRKEQAENKGSNR